LEDPLPAKGYQFKVAFFDDSPGMHFDILAVFGFGLFEAMDKKRYDAFVDAGGMQRHLNRELAGLFQMRRQREIDAVPKPPPVVKFASKDDVAKHCPSTCVVAVVSPQQVSVLDEARELATAKMVGAVQFAWLAASCNLDLVTRMGLDPTMLPAVVVWNNVKRTVSAPMRGTFAKDNLVDFARRHKQGKVPLVSPVPAGLDAVMECTAEEEQTADDQPADEVDDLMAEMRREAEREQQRKEELAKQAAEDAKRLKKEKELEAKRRREEMNRAADAEAAKPAAAKKTQPPSQQQQPPPPQQQQQQKSEL